MIPKVIVSEMVWRTDVIFHESLKHGYAMFFECIVNSSTSSLLLVTDNGNSVLSSIPITA
jgi:hypothetical protein